MQSAVIQRARPEDAPDIYRLGVVCFPQPWPLAAIESDLFSQRAAYFMARARLCGEAAGYSAMHIVLDTAEVTNICVLPQYRRQGLGERLLDALLQAARERGAGEMTLEVRVSNEAAIALYQKKGFAVEGCRKKYYPDNKEDAYLMWNRNIVK